MDLNTGRVSVVFQAGKTVESAALWKAVKDSGFTPAKVEIGDAVYKGPAP